MTFNRQTEGWRDALCSLINKEVKTASEEDGVFLKVIFLDGDELQLSLIEEDKNLKGNEAAHLIYGGEFVVWHSS